jgi:hypothetical protein
MPETRAVAELTPEIWDEEFSVETFQSNPFAAYSGTGAGNIIRMKEDFKSKRGNGISFEFITQLNEDAITGRTPLEGNEDQLGEYGDKVFWDRRKKGISIHEIDAEEAAIDLRAASRENLRDWADQDIKKMILRRSLDVGEDCDVDYFTGSDLTNAKNAWNVNNADRVLYGSAASNYNAVHATALATVNNTVDQGKAGKKMLGILKRMAATASPKITPVKWSKTDNRKVFVVGLHPFTFRDVLASLESVEAQVSIAKRNEGIFLGGDREYDGCVLHEIEDMPLIPGAGNGGIDLAPVLFMGQEAFGWGLKSRYKSREAKDGYGEVTGLGMFADYGIKKLCYRYGPNEDVHGKQRGLITGFAAAVAD